MSTDHKPFNGHTTGTLRIEFYGTEDNPQVVLSNGEVGLFNTIGDNDKENADFLLHCWNTYYTREAELSSLRASLKMCVEALDTAKTIVRRIFEEYQTEEEMVESAKHMHLSVDEYMSMAIDNMKDEARAAFHPITAALSHVKASHPNL